MISVVLACSADGNDKLLPLVNGKGENLHGFKSVRKSYSFFWVNRWHLNFMCRHFRTLCPIFIGSVNKKTNRYEITRVFIQVKVWLKRGLGPSEGGWHVRIEEQAVEGNGHKWKPVARQVCMGETALCWSEEEEPWDGSELTTVFQEAASFL